MDTNRITPGVTQRIRVENAVSQADELRRLGYDAMATADGRVAVHLTISEAVFLQSVSIKACR